MKKLLLPLFCLILITRCGTAPQSGPATPPPLPPWSSEYKIVPQADGTKLARITQRDYLFRDVIYPDETNPQSTSILVKQEVVSTYHLVSDTPPDTALKAEAWPGETNFTGTPLWSIQADAGKGEIGDHFYETTKETFADSLPVYTFYNLLNGKKTYVSNTPLLSICTASAPYLTRYLTYHSQFAEHELPATVLAPKFTGIITYGDSTKALHTLAIYGWPEDDKPDVPTLYLTYNGQRVNLPDLYLRENEDKGPKALGDFSLTVALADDNLIEIPFQNDAPQVDQAHLPTGYTLKEIPAF